MSADSGPDPGGWEGPEPEEEEGSHGWRSDVVPDSHAPAAGPGANSHYSGGAGAGAAAGGPAAPEVDAAPSSALVLSAEQLRVQSLILEGRSVFFTARGQRCWRRAPLGASRAAVTPPPRAVSGPPRARFDATRRR